MTDNEIIKALEVCSNYTGFKDCAKCPLKPNCDTNVLETLALDLINRLQAENERLKNAYKQCAYERDAYIEIENTAITEAKAEAYKEFAEDLTKKARKKEFKAIYEYDIYNLLKEKVGEDK